MRRFGILSICLLALWMGMSGCDSSSSDSTSPQSPPSAVTMSITRSPVAKVVSVHDYKHTKSATLVSLNELTYYGYVFTYSPNERSILLTNGSTKIALHIGSRSVRINDKVQMIDAAPELIEIAPETEKGRMKPIAYPFVPLQPLAKLAGWSVTSEPLTDAERRIYHGSAERLIFSKPLPTSTATLTWKQVIAQHLIGPTNWADHRVRVSPSFSIDASRTGDYSRGRYVAQLDFSVTVTGNSPVYTGDFANFIQADDGSVINQGTQSSHGYTAYLIPGKKAAGNTDRQLYPFGTNQRIKRIIYNDGLSCATWDIR